MQTIGEQLRQARVARDATIAQVAKATAIRGYYLEALEADKFEALPSPLQARGFLRNYAAYLELDAVALVYQLRTLTAPPEVLEKVEDNPVGPTEDQAGETELDQTAVQLSSRMAEPDIERKKAADFEERPQVSDGRPEFPEEPPEAPAPDLIFPTPRYLEPEGEEAARDDLAEATRAKDDEPSLPLSRSIFLEIGQHLRQRRELLSLSLDEIERHTRIPHHHLEKLEAGDFELLSSPVQARGMLTSYARFIDLDAETVLLRFADAIQAQREERHPLRPRRRPSQGRSILPPSVRRFISTDLVFGGGLLVAIAVFAVWGTARVITLRSEGQAGGHAQSISQVLLATQDVNATPTLTAQPAGTENAFVPAPPTVPAETPTAFPTRFSSAPVELIVIASGRTWMRISVDGKTKFEGRTTPGGVYSFDGDKQIELLVADGGVIQLIYNRQNIGSPGGPGEVVNLIYRADTVLLPTPTITPSPTRTPRPTATPRPSSTPRFTPTPVSTGPIG